MENLDTNAVAAGLAGSSGHITTLHDIYYDAFYLTQLPYYDYSDYLGGGAAGLVGAELAANDAVTSTVLSATTAQTDQGGDIPSLEPHHLEFTPPVAHPESSDTNKDLARLTNELPGILKCPGLGCQDPGERDSELVTLLEIAEADGAAAREAGPEAISTNGNGCKCIICGKSDKRRDRILTHVLYKHLGLKTWACPLCKKRYATRDDLAHHLKAIRVACLCGKYISQKNWYPHSAKCKACLALARKPRLENGRIVVETEGTTTNQAGPSVPISPKQKNRGDQAHAPRAQGRRPDVVRKSAAKRKRDDESGDEKKSKRVKRDHA